MLWPVMLIATGCGRGQVVTIEESDAQTTAVPLPRHLPQRDAQSVHSLPEPRFKGRAMGGPRQGTPKVPEYVRHPPV